MDISRAAAQVVPDEMAGRRSYAGLLAGHAIDPDLWKADDPAEGPRHYIEPEHLRPLNLADLPPRLDDYYRRVGYRHPNLTGIAPWVIAETQTRLTAAMRAGDWSNATVLAAALGHYVGDIHEPLHCTADFDGQLSGHSGIHIRWEMNAVPAYWKRGWLRPEPGRYLDDPWGTALGWMTRAHERVGEIFMADDAAREATSNDVDSTQYLARVWAESKSLTIEQMNAAATALASLWYTAWVDAGRPAIPPPPADFERASIHRRGRTTRWTPHLGVILGCLAVGFALIVLLGGRARRRHLRARAGV